MTATKASSDREDHGHSQKKPVRKCDCYDCNKGVFCEREDHGHSKKKPVRKYYCYVGSCLRATVQRMCPGTDLATFTGITTSGPPIPAECCTNVFYSSASISGGFAKAFGALPAHVLAASSFITTIINDGTLARARS